MTWLHEDLEDEDDESEKSKRPPDAVNADEQPPYLPSPETSNLEPKPDAQNNATRSKSTSSVPEKDDTANGVIPEVRTGREKASDTSQDPPPNESPQSAEASVNQIHRRVGSPRAEKPSKPKSTAANMPSKPEDETKPQQQRNGRMRKSSSQLPPAASLDDTKHHQPLVPAELRRSKRIAVKKANTRCEVKPSRRKAPTAKSRGRSKSAKRTGLTKTVVG